MPAGQKPVIHEVIAYLRVRRAPEAIGFYQKVFGAKELFRLSEPSGRVGHAELEIGGVKLMLSDEYPEHDNPSPESLGGTTMAMYLQVDDVDQLMADAVAAGASIIDPAADQFYGERSGKIRDPFGHQWKFSQTIEQVSIEEMQSRLEAISKSA
ncbi:VOC family protein [Undibacterium sp.]|jgi:PhnB protein|uniref:VOC family protein n=1 Tax=Undibacterium sp. TaxID=1914977 RepID=UPI002D1DEDC0|nr:VOC family protein [Undibacterium sp.]HTD04242.1 VOC family protein [Undibacterium sp.]